MDRLDDWVGFGGHDREQRMVGDVGAPSWCLDRQSTAARSRQKEEGLLVGALKPPPHDRAFRRILVGLGEGCRRNDAAPIGIDVQGFVAAAHHLFEVPADQPVVLDQVADFPRREGVEVAHGAGVPWWKTSRKSHR